MLWPRAQGAAKQQNLSGASLYNTDDRWLNIGYVILEHASNCEWAIAKKEVRTMFSERDSKVSEITLWIALLPACVDGLDHQPLRRLNVRVRNV